MTDCITTEPWVVATSLVATHVQNYSPGNPNVVPQPKGSPSLSVPQLHTQCFCLTLVTADGFINVYKAFCTATDVLQDINGILMKTRAINLANVLEKRYCWNQSRH
jgi:hypothetical protein